MKTRGSLIRQLGLLAVLGAAITEPVCFHVARHGNELQYLDDKRVVYQGFVRSRAAARMFEGVTER